MTNEEVEAILLKLDEIGELRRQVTDMDNICAGMSDQEVQQWAHDMTVKLSTTAQEVTDLIGDDEFAKEALPQFAELFTMLE